MPELTLRLAPARLPSHLTRRDGFVYAKLVTTTAVLPRRFVATPPRATLIAGLERGAFDMRARFERSIADGADRDELRHVLGACFAGMFGLRANGPSRRGLLAWARTLDPGLTSSVAFDERPDDTRHGIIAVARDWATGHAPADHDPYLYDFAEAIPALADARFEQHVSRRGAYKLRAWLRGTRYEAPARDRGDYVDVASMVGFVNAILAARRDDHRLLEVDDGERVLVGTRAQLRAR